MGSQQKKKMTSGGGEPAGAYRRRKWLHVWLVASPHAGSNDWVRVRVAAGSRPPEDTPAAEAARGVRMTPVGGSSAPIAPPDAWEGRSTPAPLPRSGEEEN